MNIGDIEEAVDRIISKREQPEKDQSIITPQKQQKKKVADVCPECEKRKRMKNHVVHSLKSDNRDVICPGRHADVVDSLVSSKKKAM